jgi:hypothetical protein
VDDLGFVVAHLVRPAALRRELQPDAQAVHLQGRAAIAFDIVAYQTLP